MAGPFGKVDVNEKSFTHAAFTGLRNNVATNRFELGDLDAAVNIDLDDTGRAMRRQGFGSRIMAGSCHSLGPSGEARCFFVSGTILYEVLQDLTTVVIVTGITPGLPVSYFVNGMRYYWTNGVDKGCIEPTGNRSWGLGVPPRIAGEVVGGALRLGQEDIDTARYQFTMTFLRNDGQESGAPMANYIDLPDNGGISFDDLPVSTDPTVDRKAIYVSEPNGEKMFRAIVVSNETTSVIYRNRGRMSLGLATQFLGPPPAATMISQQGGSLLLVVGSKLHYSEPYAFELFDRRKYKVFPAAINILCSFDDGSFVGTENEHVWVAANSPENYDWRSRATYGAIPGTLARCDSDVFGKSDITGPVGIWATKEGIVIGTADGQLRNLTKDKFLYPIQPRGAGLFRVNRGVNQFVTVLQGTETPAKSFSQP